jgi:hypothetical protein
MRVTPLCVLLLCTSAAPAESETDADTVAAPRGSDLTPDLRNDETVLKLQKGDFVIVPIPISNPTLDTGLVVGGAYFYSQTEEEKRTQPASVTAVGGMYTSNDSFAFGIGQQNYWKEDAWRFSGALGHADLDLILVAPDGSGSGVNTNWAIRGDFLQAALSRKVFGDWYLGVLGRYVDVEQSIDTILPVTQSDTSPKITSAGLGVTVEYDARDMPLNTYEGRFFEASALFNDESFGSDKTYQSYAMAYRAYYELSRPIVLAWEVKACTKGGAVPLWDLCMLGLRGFSATDYLARSSTSAQFEARWRMNKRWGLVGFAGGGYLSSSFSDVNEREIIPSYGIGVRFMVLPAKRINIRVDFARSTDSNAVHLSVGEAF